MAEKRIQAQVQAQFGRVAEKYVASESHAKGSDLELLVEWLSPKPDWMALDIATGGGHVAKALAPHVQRVTATDLTSPMLQAARKHLTEALCVNVDYVVADAEALPFLEGSFDLVTCRIAPHHFPHPEVFIEEAARVLKPGGSFLLIDNVAPNDPDLAEYLNRFEWLRDKSHGRCLSISEWEMRLTNAGFSVVQSRTRKKTHPFDTWVRRMLESDSEIEEVENYILSGSPAAKQYFGVEVNNEHVEKLHIDEWMVVCRKV